MAVDAAAVLVDGRSPTAIAKAHGLSRSWLYELISRFHQGGYEALEPLSRRPHSCSHQVEPSVVSAIVQLRQKLIEDGHDAGAQTIRWRRLARAGWGDKLRSRQRRSAGACGAGG